ncbi:aromatic acid exporter family protein [Cyanobium sp. Morenito 9A2]|uniref:FUSC family protein n=1 Tax=Cyanobium sp. Morenito 9A2 TaxID=2823718 RepID=UPI0020CBF0EE|nr:FUSC family protein [Cyanobium sp. Morenito 9A2]
MQSQLVRNSLRLGLSVLFTASIALWCQRIEFVWYPLLAVIFVVDDNDELTLRAARSRLFGTVAGGLVAFLVHTICQGWPAVLLSLVITVPLLRLLGWQGGLSTAATITLLFLLVPRYSALNWDYVFNRSLDTSVGIVLAIGVSLLFWPRDRLARIEGLDRDLHGALEERLRLWRHWRQGSGPRPPQVNPRGATGSLLELERLVGIERSGHARQAILRERWSQRLLLWSTIHHHWFQLERLLERQPEAPAQASPLLRLALEEEQKRLDLALRAQRRCERHPRTDRDLGRARDRVPPPQESPVAG